jgi:serine/threonine protein kinase
LSKCIPKTENANDVYEMTGNTGSLRFMAPEVVLNEPYNEKCDVYSFSLILWTIMETTLPYENLTGRKMHEDLVLKNGKFGLYVEWGGNKKSLKDLKKPMEKITREDIESVLNGDYETGEKNPKIVRVINSSCSIRRGRFGMYAYYKPEHLQKPLFLNIKKMTCGYLKSSEEEVMKWLKETYNL